MRFNIMRYTDNDRDLMRHWVDRCKLPEAKPHVLLFERRDRGYYVEGVIAANTLSPAAEFKLEYAVDGNELTVDLEYRLADYVKKFPRFGIELALDSSYDRFSYVGYGPTETYVDKHVAADYGYYESTAKDNYCLDYLKPQESGSHYYSTYLSLDGLFTVTAERPFSFSYNPYSTEQLIAKAHSFELIEDGSFYLSLDLAMRGVGSHSCGPELDERYEIPREDRNRFKLIF